MVNSLLIAALSPLFKATGKGIYHANEEQKLLVTEITTHMTMRNAIQWI